MRSASDVSRILPIVVLLLLVALPSSAQETPPQADEQQPSVDDNSAEGPVPESLPPPLARPPAGLELVRGAPLRRAQDHLDRADVLDALAVRVLRRVDGASPCDLIEAAIWEASLAFDLARAEQATAAAFLSASTPEADGAASLPSRLEGLGSRLADLADGIERAGVQARAARCQEQNEAPVYLPSEYTVPVDGSTGILLRAGAQGDVVWIDGAPAVAAGPGGWTIAVVPAGLRRVCVTAPEDPSCPEEREIDAAMGAGFDLR